MLKIHHIALTSANLKKATLFYSSILKPFGYKQHGFGEKVCSWIPSGEVKMPEILIYATKELQKNNVHQLYDPGVHHYCF